MNFRKILLGVAALAATPTTLAQYVISGQVSGVPDGSKLYLSLVGKGYYERLDSTFIDNGHFSFSGPHQEKPRWALVQIENNFVALCDFYLEDGQINISGSRYSTEAHGTATNEELFEYNRDINAMYNELTALNYIKTQDPDIRRSDSAAVAMKECEAEMARRVESFIRRYPASVISVRAAETQIRTLPSSRIKELLQLFSPEMQRSPEVQKMNDYADRLEKTEGGAKAIPFTLPDAEGRQHSLKDYEGHYVLLDFWASWCAPCRGSFPEVARISEKYKPMGLVVVGISLDRNEQAWRKALAEEKAPWEQLLDQTGEVGRQYAVLAIPHMVIVSPEGRIIGSYNKAETTEELQRLFGE